MTEESRKPEGVGPWLRRLRDLTAVPIGACAGILDTVSMPPLCQKRGGHAPHLSPPPRPFPAGGRES